MKLWCILFGKKGKKVMKDLFHNPWWVLWSFNRPNLPGLVISFLPFRIAANMHAKSSPIYSLPGVTELTRKNLRIVLGIHYNEDLHLVLIFNSPGRVFHCYEVNLIPWLAIKHLCLNRGLLASCFWNNLWVSITFWKTLNFMWHLTSRSQLSLNKQAGYVIKIEWSCGW